MDSYYSRKIQNEKRKRRDDSEKIQRDVKSTYYFYISQTRLEI